MTAVALIMTGAAVVLAFLLTVVLVAYHQRPRVVVNLSGDLDPERVAALLRGHLDHLDRTRRTDR